MNGVSKNDVPSPIPTQSTSTERNTSTLEVPSGNTDTISTAQDRSLVQADSLSDSNDQNNDPAPAESRSSERADIHAECLSNSAGENNEPNPAVSRIADCPHIHENSCYASASRNNNPPTADTQPTDRPQIQADSLFESRDHDNNYFDNSKVEDKKRSETYHQRYRLPQSDIENENKPVLDREIWSYTRRDCAVLPLVKPSPRGGSCPSTPFKAAIANYPKLGAPDVEYFSFLNATADMNLRPKEEGDNPVPGSDPVAGDHVVPGAKPDEDPTSSEKSDQE